MSVKELVRMTPAEVWDRAKAQRPSTAQNIIQSLIPQSPADPWPEFSVITCSVQDGRFNQIREAYKVAFAGENYELIRISDAKSLAEGYQRGLSQARGRIVVFTHDDAAPLRPIAARLRNHLRRVDIVAGAGSDRLDGPAWFTAGPPHVFGQVLNVVPARVQTPDGKVVEQAPFMLTVYGVPAALVPGIQVFDGFWFAANRDVLDYHTFDGVMCEGFHMYDVDFSYRAYLKGIKIGVATDLYLAHASVGGYGDPKWKPAADKWMAQYGSTLPPHRPVGFQMAGVSGADQNILVNIMDEFVERAR